MSGNHINPDFINLSIYLISLILYDFYLLNPGIYNEFCFSIY